MAGKAGANTPKFAVLQGARRDAEADGVVLSRVYVRAESDLHSTLHNFEQELGQASGLGWQADRVAKLRRLITKARDAASDGLAALYHQTRDGNEEG